MCSGFPPRSDRRRPIAGVFKTRSPDRPNPLGLHAVTVRAIAGSRLLVGPIEAIDGTPVVDIKACLDGECPSERRSDTCPGGGPKQLRVHEGVGCGERLFRQPGLYAAYAPKPRKLRLWHTAPQTPKSRLKPHVRL